ncbi:MAG: hypothetical protein FJX31_11885 [Alphaproteobacteria bacterium]|nr:hypothetical protein [Alphaproteobacteria bacterium]
MELFFRSGSPIGTARVHVDGARRFVTVQPSCGKCGGMGVGPWRQDGGRCYQCGGCGVLPARNEKVYDAEALAKLRATQAKRDATKAAKQAAAEAAAQAKVDAAAEQFNAANPGLIDWVRAKRGGFFESIAEQFAKRGTLSDAQVTALVRIREQDAARAAQGTESQHVGVVGDRHRLVLRVRLVRSFESMYGLIWLHVCEDEGGNVVVYKGSKELAARGETVTVDATVAEHGEREGVRQTIVKRPKIVAA